MTRTRRFAQQIFCMRKVAIDRTEVVRLESGALVARTAPTLAVAVCPSPARGVEPYQYVPAAPDDAYAETAEHLHAWYGIPRHQLRIDQRA